MIFYVVMLIGIFLDQSTKYFLVTCSDHLPKVVTSFFNIVLAYNKGISFSFLNNYSSVALISLISIITFWVLRLFLTENNKHDKWCYTLILSGAIGNLIDRFRFGAVVDFLDFYYKDIHYPAFNIADSLIFLGVTGLFLFRKKKQQKP